MILNSPPQVEHGDLDWTETVAGVSFEYHSTQTMYAYHQGRFHTLQEAYDLGLMTKAELLALKEDYDNTDHSSQGTIPIVRAACNHTTSSETEITIEKEIMEAYYNTVEDDDFREHYTTADLSLRFRGAFSDTYVVFVDGPYGYPQAVTSETVGGITFTYGDYQHPYAYHQGKFYSLTEAYELGYLTIHDLMQLKEDYPEPYGENSISSTNKGEVPTVREACNHTKNSKPADSTLLMPDIPSSIVLCSKPDVLSAETLVSTIYDYSISWDAGDGNAFTCSVRLPAITPFSTDAIAINEAIRQTFQYRVQAARYSFDQKSTPSFKSIHYTTYLYNHVLTVQITQEDYAGLALNSTWMLDVSTGKNVTTAELAKQHLNESYPAFLQHRTHDLIEYYKANPLDNADDQAKLLQNLAFDTFAMQSNTLYLSSDGALMLTFHVHDADQTFTLPYANMDIYGFESTDADAYHWLFHLQTDGAYADEWSTILKECFFLAPQEFVSMLSKEENATIARVASSINYALHLSEETESYRALCKSIRDLSANKQHSETAQILLNAIKPL